MKIKKHIADTLKMISPSDLGRATGCTRQLINAQLNSENLEAGSLTKYARLLGCREEDLYADEPDWEIRPVPFHTWLENNINKLPANCFNAHGKVRLMMALELWEQDR